MRVAINCLQIDPSYAGGVNTYTLGLLEGFAAIANGCRFRLYVTSANQHLFEKFRKRDHFDLVAIENARLSVQKNICRAALLSFNWTMYKQTSNLMFGKIKEEMDQESDVIYTPSVVLQCFDSRKPTVLSMHDIQHLHYPEFFSWQRRLSRKITYGLSALHASYFQASSNFIKDDLLSHFTEIAAEQIEVIPEGVDSSEFAARNGCDAELDRYCLPDRFLFCPAQLWPHKNHLTILRALKMIEKVHGLKIPLILTGAKFSAAPQVFDFIAAQSMPYVWYLGKVPFRTLVALYQRAAFLITAVLYESSSLPILEAAAAGIPIIASRTPPNEEIGQILQLNMFEPLDAEDLARLLLTLWQDEKTASAQSTHNRERIGHYSWENAARKYVQLFERIVNS
jgi:glycosyltransferase involved in cell wall biosynthesis